ncbi:2'-5'-oligoadenylate synthase 3 [Lemmus lemmus]
MAEGLRTILRLVQQHRSLCVYWTVNYSTQDPALRVHLLSQLQKASCFRQFSEQGSRRAEIISEIRAQLEACQQKQKFDVKFEISHRKNPRVLSFSLTSQTLLDHCHPRAEYGSRQ